MRLDTQFPNFTRIVAAVFLFITVFLLGAGFLLLPTAVNLLTDPNYMQLTPYLYGTLAIPLFLGTITASFIAGKIADALTVKGLYLFSLWVLLLAVTLFGSSHFAAGSPRLVYTILFLYSVGCGLAYGTLLSSGNALVAEVFHERAPMGIVGYYAFFGLGTAVSPLIYNRFYDLDIWWMTPFFYAFVLFFSFGTLLMTLPSHIRKQGREGKVHIKAGYIYLALFMLFYSSLYGLMTQWGVKLMQEGAEVKLLSPTLALSLFWGGVTLSRLINPFLLLRFTTPTLYLFWSVCIVFTFLPFFFTLSPLVAKVVVVLVGMACACGFPMTFYFAKKCYPEAEVTVSSHLLAFYIGGYAISAFIIGSLYEYYTLKQIARGMFVVTLLLVVVTWKIIRECQDRSSV